MILRKRQKDRRTECVFVCVRGCVCESVCLCLREKKKRERKREKEREQERARKTEQLTVNLDLEVLLCRWRYPVVGLAHVRAHVHPEQEC